MTKTHIFLLSIGFLLLSVFAQAQQKYYVYLTDKNGVEFNPYTYFDQKAIENRTEQGLPLFDETDLPVNENYKRIISDKSDSIGFASRWLNFVTVYLSNENQLKDLQSLGFVKSIEKAQSIPLIYAGIENTDDEFVVDYDAQLLERQLMRFGANKFYEKGIDGSGIRIAVFDGGFPEVQDHPAFKHIFDNDKLIKTWDFVKNKDFVFYGNKHGRMTLACVGGMYDGKKIGLATGAEFLLAKTEVGTEPFFEEENWLAAAEWADKNGVNVINSSLGYGYHRYFNWNMDGKTSLVVKAAEMAARKGILVVNSAGNEASDKWEGIITPSDGDSVLCIGGIDPETDYHISFSSYGPTADRRLKPNVSAYGHVLTAGESGLSEADGTSFSSPLVAGFAACAWQCNRSLSNMELFHEIEKSGHLYPYFDYAHGYGVPQAAYFTNTEKINSDTTFIFSDTGQAVLVIVKPEVYNNKEWLIDMNLLYYHVQNPDRTLKGFYVIKVEQPQVLVFNKNDYEGKTIRVYFRGFTSTIKFDLINDEENYND